MRHLIKADDYAAIPIIHNIIYEQAGDSIQGDRLRLHKRPKKIYAAGTLAKAWNLAKHSQCCNKES